MEKYFSVNQSGCSIRCKLYCTDRKSVKKIVLFGHGFSGHKDNRAAEKLATRIQKRHADTALIVFDLPCHGDDAKGKLTLDDCMKYIGIMSDHAKKEFRTDELYGCATSFGGYLFLRYIAQNGSPFIKLALRCPAVPMYDVLTKTIMTGDDLAALGKKKPVLVGFDRKVKVTDAFITELEKSDIEQNDYSAYADDMLIIHGTKDEIVPFDTVREFAEKNGIRFVPVEDADHRFTDPKKMDFVIDTFIKFLFENA